MIQTIYHMTLCANIMNEADGDQDFRIAWMNLQPEDLTPKCLERILERGLPEFGEDFNA